MVDLQALRHTIANAPADKPAAGVVTIDWLRQVERDLTELASIRKRRQSRAHA